MVAATKDDERKPSRSKAGITRGIIKLRVNRDIFDERKAQEVSPDTVGTIVQRIAKIAVDDRSALVKKVRKGLPFNSIVTLEKAYHASRKEIGDVLLIPPSTMNRRKNSGKLHPDESDRVIRLARIIDAATAMMDGNKEAAAQWMRTPRDILGGETPLQHASTELGSRDVEDLIGRIRHGVFS